MYIHVHDGEKILQGRCPWLVLVALDGSEKEVAEGAEAIYEELENANQHWRQVV